MKRLFETYGDNFPVARGLCWDSRTPWRHAHVMPGRRVARWAQVGWWGLVVLLMGLVVLLTVRDGYSEEPASTGELVVTFNDGVIRYPEGAASVLSQRVEFRSASLQRLNAHFGLVAVARVVSPARPTASTFRLRFASSTGLRRALAAYQRDPHVRSATLGLGPPSSSPRPRGAAAVCTLDA